MSLSYLREWGCITKWQRRPQWCSSLYQFWVDTPHLPMGGRWLVRDICTDWGRNTGYFSRIEERIWRRFPWPPTFKWNTVSHDVLWQLPRLWWSLPHVVVMVSLTLDIPINWMSVQGVPTYFHKSTQSLGAFYSPSSGVYHFHPEWEHYPSSTVWSILFIHPTRGTVIGHLVTAMWNRGA